jgi:hypothetical protein
MDDKVIGKPCPKCGKFLYLINNGQFETCDCSASPQNASYCGYEECCECGEPIEEQQTIRTCAANALCYYNCTNQELPLCLYSGYCDYQTPRDSREG